MKSPIEKMIDDLEVQKSTNRRLQVSKLIRLLPCVTSGHYVPL